MNQLQTKIPTDTWVTATWDEYIRAVEDPAYQKAKGYYYNHQFRIEMSPLLRLKLEWGYQERLSRKKAIALFHPVGAIAFLTKTQTAL